MFEKQTGNEGQPPLWEEFQVEAASVAEVVSFDKIVVVGCVDVPQEAVAKIEVEELERPERQQVPCAEGIEIEPHGVIFKEHLGGFNEMIVLKPEYGIAGGGVDGVEFVEPPDESEIDILHVHRFLVGAYAVHAVIKDDEGVL